MLERIIWGTFLAALLAACGGGGSTTPAAPPAWHNVTLSWTANHEAGVNSTGGGYTLTFNGASSPAPVDVPYVSGAQTPTSKVVPLYTGSYTATVTAYTNLAPTGVTGKTSSQASSTLNITVP